MKSNFDLKKYFLVFLITLGIFLTAIFLSNYFSNKKLNQLKFLQNQISLDILSLETQYSLLEDISCKNVSESILSKELGELGQKIEWGQDNLGNQSEVEYLRKYYFLLEIKDYLLSKVLFSRCGVKSAFVLYFYNRLEDCPECEKQGLVLSSLREKYPELKVYSFDYGIDLSAVESMIEIYKIEATKLPALVVDGEVFTGFQPIDKLETLILGSFELQEATSEEEEEEGDKTEPIKSLPKGSKTP